jgi:hypothetical protein
MVGWSVFTLPPSISGALVISETSLFEIHGSVKAVEVFAVKYNVLDWDSSLPDFFCCTP